MLVREATAADNQALIALQARCPQGTTLVFSTTNTPDFFARARAYPAHHVFVAQADGHIVGSAACGLREVLLGGEARTVSYEFQYFTAPEARGRGVARALRGRIEQALVAAGATLSYALLVEGNAPSRRLFERQGFRPHRTLQAAAFLPYRPVDVEGVVRPLTPDDYPAAADLLQAAWGGHDFHEPLSAARLRQLVERLPAFAAGDFWGLEEGDELVACLGIWDWSRITRVVVQRLPPQLRLIGVALDTLRLLRPVPRMLKAGQEVRQWGLILPGFRDPARLAPLLRHTNNEALRRGADTLVALCARDDPLLRASKGLFHATSGVHLYVKPLQALALGDHPVHLDAIDL